jgi:hypothetical protein
MIAVTCLTVNNKTNITKQEWHSKGGWEIDL